MNRHSPIALALALAGCATAAPPPLPALPAGPAQDADCGAASLSGWIGREATPQAVAALRGWRGDHPVRVLRPGSAMTMDFRPGRLNVFLDDRGGIEKFTCN